MSHCHDEHAHHGDGGSSDHTHAHAHDHSSDLTPAIQNHLYSQIDFTAIRALNEREPGSGRAVLSKPWTQRHTTSPELLSAPDDPQILLHVPFTGQVRLHSIHIRGPSGPSAPRTLKVYANNEALDFAGVGDAAPTQTFELAAGTAEVQDVNVKRTLFGGCRCLALFFEDNFADDEEVETRVSYVGFKGDFLKLSREPVEVLYEAAARPQDHKVKTKDGGMTTGMGFSEGGGSGRQGF